MLRSFRSVLGCCVRWVRQTPEVWFALLACLVLLRSRFVGEEDSLQLDVMLYIQLAAAFASGVILMATAALGADTLRSIDRVQQRSLGALTLMGSIAICGWLLYSYPTRYAGGVGRLLEAAALSVVFVYVLLAIYLLSSGVLSFLLWLKTCGRFLKYWLGLFLYLPAGGYCLMWLNELTPTLYDPLLMKVDLSFDGLPAWSAYRWGLESNFVQWLNANGYPLLGPLIALIPACLYAAGAYAHARRSLLALLIVAWSGMLCYYLLPAIGPVYAFESSMHLVVTESNADDFISLVRDSPDYADGQTVTHARNVFPSLHTAFTLVALTSAWFWRRWLFFLCLPLGLIQILTAITTGYHYLIDLIAAFPFAAACWWGADRLLSRPVGYSPQVVTPERKINFSRRGMWVSFAALLLWLWVGEIPIGYALILTVLMILTPVYFILVTTRRISGAS